jgi:hypothetical protein
MEDVLRHTLRQGAQETDDRLGGIGHLPPHALAAWVLRTLWRRCVHKRRALRTCTRGDAKD